MWRPKKPNLILPGDDEFAYADPYLCSLMPQRMMMAAGGGGYRYHMLNITANNGHSSLIVMEFEIWVDATKYPYPGITTVMTSYTAPSPLVCTVFETATDEGWQAFSTAGVDRWYKTSCSFPTWLKIDLGAGNQIMPTGYKVQGANGANPTMAPKDFTFQGSNDDSAWDTLLTVTGETSWSNEEVRT